MSVAQTNNVPSSHLLIDTIDITEEVTSKKSNRRSTERPISDAATIVRSERSVLQQSSRNVSVSSNFDAVLESSIGSSSFSRNASTNKQP